MAKSTGGSQDDISQLENLDDVTILKLLEERYKSNFIYTNCGNILIAVNPCKSLDVYGKEYNDFYDWKTFQSNPPPHIYHVAARAYRGMRETSTNQVILVCGESGAGKTESTKYMVRHFMAMCPDETGDLHERIIEVNPLLEAFGNAKTIMNSNSSRFAKYLELCFRADGQVLGATVRDYMLEKSRVVTKCHGEGNFHIFYALFEGAPKAKLTELGLQKQETYRILEDKSGEVKKAHDYKEMYNSSMAILKKIQMTEGDISIVHSLLAAVLHISQVEFVEMDRNTEKLDVRDTEVIQLAADCLCVDFETLGHALISTTRAMRDENGREETIVSYKSMQQAEDGRNALAKSIFERLFGYIVRKVNENLHPSKSRTNKVASIGLLDIAGFEKLQVNSFEQMCINLTNERLQNHMNTTVIVNEKLLYTEEGIPFADIKFQNNSDVVNLFNARGGILAILDEVTKIQQGSDHMFVQRVQHAFKDSPQKSYLTFDKGDRAEFCVKHFAGQVWYNCNGFREKNMDTLNPDLEKCLKESRDPFIQDMFTVKKGPTGTISATIHNWRKSMGNILGASTKAPKSRAAAQLASELGQTLTKRYGKIGKATEMIYMTKDNKSVVAYFQKSLNELLNKMIHAESYFVRCIKPNMELKSGELDMNIIKNQLKYNGILEIAVIRKMGFSVRKTYDDFIERYSKLFKVSPGKEGTRTILHKILPVSMHEDFRLGKHKVFMKEEASTWLEKVLFIRENVAARTITRGIKTVCVQKREERIEKERKERIEKEKFEKEQRIKQEKLKRERQEAAQRDKMNKKLTDIDKGNEDPESVLSNPSSTLRESLSSTSSSSGGSSSSYSSEQNSDQKEFDISKLRGTKKPSQFEGKKKAVKTDEVKIKIDSKKKPPPLPPARKTHYFWDIFQIITRENPERDVHTHLSLRIIKVVTYFLLFVILLGAMVIQKITLMTLVSYQISTNQTYHEKDYKTQRSVSYVFLMVAMCSPYALVLIISIWRSLFSNLPFPSIGNLIAVSLVEMLHSIGLCLLVFRVLPLFHMAQGIMLMTSTCILPSILKPLCSKENNRAYNNCSSTPCKVLIFVMDLVSIFVQMSAIPVVLLSNSTDYILKQSADTTSIDMVEIGFALFLSSFSWWENFIDDRFCGNAEKSNAFGRAVMGLKFDLQESRPYIFMVASAWKLITALVTSWLLQNWENDIDIFSSHILETFRDKGLHNQQSQAILGLTLSSLVGYYIAYTACKLKMQTFSFSLPLLLSTPITIAIVVIRCEVLHSHFDIFFEFHNCDTSDFLRPWYHVVFGTVWCISFYWIGRHIWFSTQERLAKVERLFMNPLYCGILLEQHLVMNRRRHNRRITKATNGKRNCYRLSKEDMKVGGSEEIMEKEKTIPPMIYACATMWHENRQEMVQILKSLYRMDNDQFVRRQAANMSHNAKDTEYYEFEVHILFDDAFEINDDEEMVPNDFVKMFCDLQNEACSSVHSRPMIVNPPIRIPSPYGGQLVFSMPGGNLMYVHLKDKAKIRHRKRWSQVMYMYYLLGYRIVKECQSRVLLHMENDNLNELVSWRKCEATGLSGRSQIFQLLDDEVIFRAENTFLLALDGDVDFTPGAVRLLMDRMCKNLKVGAACGRIHPIGKGPMVWYQKFEYATAHWLQKATEHVLGCVLCSPGCFSLFRGSALMDDNIMRKYTILPTEASHHLMYDQGEDRWLCTLLLQQGYRVDYAAASDAYTYAPEAFDEFFNQRRRWMPSTIANIMDLLQDGKNTVAVNNNISWLYIFYQAALMVSTIIGPSTVLMMIAGSILTVFNLNLVNSYIISLAPALFYFFICFIVKSKTQILIAQVLSAVYTFIMMVVLVGAIMTAAQESPFHPSVIFLAGIVAIFLIAALLHPREFSCIIYGVLYFLWVPSGFLLLVFYSLCNLHVVSWGTREVPKKKTKKELEAEEQKKKEETEKKKQGWFARIFGTTNIGSELKDVLKELPGQKKDSEKLTGLLEQLNKNIEILATQKHAEKHEISKVEEKTEEKTEPKKKTGKSVTFNTDVEEKLIQEFDEEEYMYHKEKKKRNELKNPAWTECPELGNGDIMDMNPGETEFWKKFIGKYLYPLDAEKYKEKNKQAAAKLLELRNNICAGMALINLLWLGINFMFQLRKPTVVTLPSPIEAEEVTNENNIKVDILGLLFVIFFLVIMLIQFVGMIVHRWGTFMHLIAITEIPNPFRKSHDASVDKKSKARDAVEMCQRLMAELMPDYSDDEDDDLQRQTTETVKEAIINLSKTGTKDNLGESRNAGLAKSLRGSSAMPLNALPESNKHTMSDEGFRSTVNEFLSKSRNHDNNPTSTENPEIRRRQTGRRTDVTETMNLVGRTIPRNVASHQRKFGYQTPYQKEFLAIAEERKLAQRYNMSAPPKISDASGAASLGQSYRKDYSHDDEDFDEDIYDEIPAFKSGGTLGRGFAKRLIQLEKSANISRNGASRSRVYGQNTFTNAAFSDDTSAKEFY